jgi:hypothetical protein
MKKRKATPLSKNKNFIPCPEDEGDELFANGFFVFNITHLRRFLESNDSVTPLSELQVKDFPRFGNNLDEPYVDSTDLSEPVIVAEIAPGRHNLIDGNHRMEKARKNGIESLPGYEVPPQIHTRFLTSQNAYDSYIDYWNEKVEEGHS